MSRASQLVSLSLLFALAQLASADVFNMPAGLVSLETTAIGNAGNINGNEGRGAVGYNYEIGAYEVTAAQYTEFLNAVATEDTYGLFNTEMTTSSHGCQIQRSGAPGSYTYTVNTDAANRPVNKVSWADAARFANWLHNGQPTGSQNLTTTEDGSYYLNGATTTVDILAATRESGATYVIPTEDEWFKAAYHKNDGPTDHYWLYPTSSDADPTAALVEPDPGNHANFNQMLGAPPWRTVVGEFENSLSPYGTYDQAGNLYEMTEGLDGANMISRGGAYWYNDAVMRTTYNFTSFSRLSEESVLGFRIAVAPPTPLPDVFDMGADQRSLETVLINNAGNAAGTDTHGAVAYEYYIGKYEITAAQYTVFLNAVAADDTHALYSTAMTDVNGCQIQRSGLPGDYRYHVDADAANRPVNKISWADAARFVNWLQNGQPTGVQDVTTTEDGAYALNGATGGTELLSVSRRSDWRFAIANEDEWFKAAYHKNNGSTDHYWLYPTSSNTDPTAAIVNPDPGNHANFDKLLGAAPWRTAVGEFENSAGAYGTFDQGGNVLEMTDTLAGSQMVCRGGSYWTNDAVMRKTNATGRDLNNTRLSEENNLGFRIVIYSGAPRCGHWGYCPADLNHDCRVEATDAAIFAHAWLDDIAAADLNDDDSVDLIDVASLTNQWQQCTDPDAPGCADQKLIQMGWDMQPPDQLAANIAPMQTMPFDGITIRAAYSYTFEMENINPPNVAADVITLSNIDFGKFDHNFFYVVTGANVDWFDDVAWADDGFILNNIGYVAQAAHAAGCVGLLFDPEFIYWGNEYGPFRYSAQAQAPARSFTDIASMARARGVKFMNRIQQEMSDPVIMNLFWVTHGFFDACDERDPAARAALLESNQYGLLPAFMSGMLQAATPGTVFVDGNEPAYYYDEDYHFFRGHHHIHQNGPRLVPLELRNKYHTQVQCGHGIFSDYLCDTLGITVPSTYMPPEQRARWVEHNIYWALKTAGRYVWFYNEHINWITGANIPPELVPAIESARQKIADGAPLGFDF